MTQKHQPDKMCISMKNIKTIFLFVFLFQLVSCKPSADLRDEIDSNILLVDYKSVDRSIIASALNKINSCNAKTIGINALFIEKQNKVTDSLLATAIGLNGNVILVATHDNSSVTRSNEMFTTRAAADGLLDFQLTDGIVTDHKPLKSIENKLLWSFPFTIVAYFDPSRAVAMLNDLQGNTYYEINFNRSKDNYETIDIDEIGDIDCSKLSGKIVLLGYLGPSEEDTVITPLDQESRTHRTIVIANIISDLLEKFPSKEK